MVAGPVHQRSAGGAANWLYPPMGPDGSVHQRPERLGGSPSPLLAIRSNHPRSSHARDENCGWAGWRTRAHKVKSNSAASETTSQ